MKQSVIPDDEHGPAPAPSNPILAEIDQVYDNLRDLTITKGREYSGGVNPLGNFDRGAERCRMPPEKVWSVLFYKHMDAIDHYVINGKTLSESIEGRIDDAILYLILLRYMVRRDNQE